MALDSRPLGKVLDDVAAGHIQLPDFQREWKWDDDHVVSILATVTMGYPMGVIMTLATGGPGARFKVRPLAGVQMVLGQRPEQLLLDGQQRMTSLFQALQSGQPVDTADPRGKALRRWYYIHIQSAIDPNNDRERAIKSVPDERVIRSDFGRRIDLDLSTPELECEHGYFPLSFVFDNAKTLAWMQRYVEADSRRWALWTEFMTAVLDNVTQYQVPVIKLGKETPKEAVCTVFEKVNTGGVALDVFELLTATFAGDTAYTREHGEDFHLPAHWNASRTTCRPPTRR